LEQTVNRVITDVKRRARCKPAVFGVEQKDKAHQHREQSGVDLVRLTGERLVQKLAARTLVRRLESTHQLVEGVEHLLRQRSGNAALVFAALREERRQPRLGRGGEKALAIEEKIESRKNRAPSHLAHRGHGKRKRASVLAARRVKDAHMSAVAD